MMRVLIVGAGPAGLTLGVGLARRRHRVVVVDRDPGPAPDGSWRRKGVMQFEQAHGFRPQVLDLLKAEWPEAWDGWQGLGAETFALPSPGVSTSSVGVRSRRSTYERALRTAAARIAGLRLVVGRVDGLAEVGGRIFGAVVDGSVWPADLVVDASGRLSQLAPRPEFSGDTGMAYIGRTLHRSEGAVPGPLSSPFSWSGQFEGYDAYVFPHELGHVSAVLLKPTADPDLSVLRHVDAFEAACRAIPGLAEWTDQHVSTPTSGVMFGGGLLNTYRGQTDRHGLIAVGDAVATTAPTAGRGIAMASMQISALLELLDSGVNPAGLAKSFGDWCEAWIRPWVEDHLAIDAETVRRWKGQDLDLSQPLTSSAIVAAASADSRIWPHVGAFLAMAALPESIAPAEPLARAVYETGWRAPTSQGPTRNELLALVKLTSARP
jgi:2-polyprenyl-6-methoxyphenol hydroxylase-like FAD-dependent oxidoreductase